MIKTIKFLIYISVLTVVFLISMNGTNTANNNKINNKKILIKKTTGEGAALAENTLTKVYRKQSEVQNNLYRYLSDFNNRESVKRIAMKLNNGHQRNSCVYFVCTALRKVGYNLPLRICYTGNYLHHDKDDISLIYYLKKSGWKESKNLSMLLPGDICFTSPDSQGHFTHTYIFMGWTQNGRQDYAYVCDNQSYDYGTTLHIRNIKNTIKNKEPLYLYMYFESSIK